MEGEQSRQWFTLEEIAARCGVEVSYLRRLLSAGIIERSSDDDWLFSAEVTLRVHRTIRLEQDLEVNLAGAAVILDLLERIDALETELDLLRGRR